MLLDKSILIHAPPERVFAWLAPERMARWDPGLVRASGAGEGPLLRQGARFQRVSRAVGHRFEMEAEAVAVEPERLFAWRQVAGDYEEHRGAFLLERVPEGTRVRLTASVEYPYVMPVLVTEARLREEVSRDLDDALLNLKALAEREHAAAHAPGPLRDALRARHAA